MIKIIDYLKNGDLRSISQVNQLVTLINNQADFDRLFNYLNASDRLVAMRAADAVEKLTRQSRHFLKAHKVAYLELLSKAADKELKWHLAQLAPRFSYSDREFEAVWQCLKMWAEQRGESKIVRVNAVQALFELADKAEIYQTQLKQIVANIKREAIPSIDARLKKLELY